MFTMGMPTIYRVMEYALVLAAVVVIWQAVATRPTEAQDDGERDDFRGLLVDMNEALLEDSFDLYSITFETPVMDRTRITINPSEIYVTSIGDDYICLSDARYSTLERHCTPLSNILMTNRVGG